MTHTARKAEVEGKLQSLLDELTPAESEKKAHFVRRVASALRNEL